MGISTKSMQQVGEKLKKTLTDDQLDFFEEQGYLHFKGFLSAEEVSWCLGEIKQVEQQWLDQRRKKVYGTPIFWGADFEGQPVAHRMPHTSAFSDYLSKVLNADKLKSIARQLQPDGRIGEREKDGLVVNQYFCSPHSNMKRMGWHTDAIRYLFYLQKIKPMLNIGIHLTTSRKEMGGLRVLPGTHKQSIFSLLTRKKYYLDTKADPEEVCIETEPGDLTVHHGSMWHRVASASEECPESKRVVMYVPFICGPRKIKNEQSPTPLYHRFQHVLKG